MRSFVVLLLLLLHENRVIYHEQCALFKLPIVEQCSQRLNENL